MIKPGQIIEVEVVAEDMSALENKSLYIELGAK